MPGPELAVPEVDEVESPHKRRVALAVSLIALFGGLLGYAAAASSANEEIGAREAQRAAITAMARQNAASVTFQENLDNHAEAFTVGRRRDQAATRELLLGVAEDRERAKAWDRAYRRLADVSPLTRADRNGRAAGPAGPVETLSADLFAGPHAGTLRQQAAQETAAAWGDKSDLYIAGITLLAVALALLGLSLTVAPGVRRHLVRPAAAITGLCLLGTFAVLAMPVPRTPERAISALARGDRAYSLRDFETALREYDAALRARADYAAAYQRRAQARILVDSPDRAQSSFVFSTARPASRRAAIADLERAIELGGGDYLTLTNQSGNYFHLEDYARAEDHARRAIELNPAPPIPWINLLLAVAGQGREAEAARVFDRLTRLIAGRHRAEERLELYASARTTLDTLARQSPERIALVRRLQGRLVRAEADSRAPAGTPPGNPSVTGFQVTAYGSSVEARMTAAGLPRNARLAWLVYHRADEGADWLELHQVSAFEAWDGRAGKHFFDWNCPVRGQYRVDLYAGERRVASDTTTRPEGPALTPYHDPIGGFRTCRPPAWKLAAAAPGEVRIRSADGREELAVRVTVLATPPTPARVGYALRRVLDRSAEGLSPSAALVEEGTARIGNLPAGRYRRVRLPGGDEGRVYAHVDTLGVLRTVVLRFPPARSAALSDMTLRLRFE
ncbi:CHAT domain-containing protein [Bailinhaonella thermotolerans]|uniref:Tetratricopeptide repeat protein n=1 Tax=Bailinhaonella thermotolerans TaxID=1070861 RepID=A0A3A4BSC0_9ACTN|nr:hypothetical protein [Bailinhaonella thermotolerans]RJL34216.1 hypothetical protein D5H75_07040 [Bailinhaonella thermotolerans]